MLPDFDLLFPAFGEPESGKMRETEKAWLAGLFDGEGCVWSRIPKRSNVIVEIKMTHKETVSRVQELFPGRFSAGFLSKKGISKLPQWRWSLDTRGTKLFLEMVLPYLVTKRVAAEIAIKLCSVKTLSERTKLFRELLPEWNK